MRELSVAPLHFRQPAVVRFTSDRMQMRVDTRFSAPVRAATGGDGEPAGSTDLGRAVHFTVRGDRRPQRTAGPYRFVASAFPEVARPASQAAGLRTRAAMRHAGRSAARPDKTAGSPATKTYRSNCWREPASVSFTTARSGWCPTCSLRMRQMKLPLPPQAARSSASTNRSSGAGRSLEIRRMTRLWEC